MPTMSTVPSPPLLLQTYLMIACGCVLHVMPRCVGGGCGEERCVCVSSLQVECVGRIYDFIIVLTKIPNAFYIHPTTPNLHAHPLNNPTHLTITPTPPAHPPHIHTPHTHTRLTSSTTLMMSWKLNMQWNIAGRISCHLKMTWRLKLPWEWWVGSG